MSEMGIIYYVAKIFQEILNELNLQYEIYADIAKEIDNIKPLFSYFVKRYKIMRIPDLFIKFEYNGNKYGIAVEITLSPYRISILRALDVMSISSRELSKQMNLSKVGKLLIAINTSWYRGLYREHWLRTLIKHYNIHIITITDKLDLKSSIIEFMRKVFPELYTNRSEE